ncbi:hypothetical protein N494_02265 [Clostridium botulinum A2B7 92]|uniref:hypothetical protein n=1 Tax=Clostridium botulinum TaxID=1491 RepID=UPI0007E14FFE|nr:hypothetical protein [Clostridium botulinum]KEJ03390.1 hypothetical protein N494_02265 [Clostridium botulinum A2B7 92]
MFKYCTPCFMCIPIPIPIYPKGTQPMLPMEYDHEDKTKENKDNLKSLYPKIYFKIFPLVKERCEIMKREKGKEYCPSEKEVDTVCKEIYKRIKPELDDDEDDYTRQRRYRRRHAINDLIRIMLISQLLGI